MIHHKPGIQIKYIPCSTGQPMLFNYMNMKLENNRALKYISTEQFQTVKHGDHFLYMAKDLWVSIAHQIRKPAKADYMHVTYQKP